MEAEKREKEPPIHGEAFRQMEAKVGAGLLSETPRGGREERTAPQVLETGFSPGLAAWPRESCCVCLSSRKWIKNAHLRIVVRMLGKALRMSILTW